MAPGILYISWNLCVIGYLSSRYKKKCIKRICSVSNSRCKTYMEVFVPDFVLKGDYYDN